MQTREQALAFARQWIEAWNAHDLERIPTHYRAILGKLATEVMFFNESGMVDRSAVLYDSVEVQD